MAQFNLHPSNGIWREREFGQISGFGGEINEGRRGKVRALMRDGELVVQWRRGEHEPED